MPAKGDITVILSTFNGGNRLERTLESMTKLIAPEGGWQLIVVDNASTDSTPDILARFQDRLPLRVLKNPVAGKNASLNMALPYAVGELYIFTDDDVIVPARWLIDFLSIAAKAPDHAVFGGRILPDWPSPPGRAILEGVSVGDAYAVHDRDIPDGEIAPGKIWGPNMAVRADVFAAGHRFPENIGPAGANYVPGSESSFNIMLAQAGYRCWFDNANTVLHQIRPEQLTKAWLKARAFRLGRGTVRWALIGAKDTEARLGRFPRWYYSYLLRHWLLWLKALASFDPVGRMAGMWHIEVARGMFHEQARLQAEAKNSTPPRGR